ncbi:MAG: hypothetical protein K6F17_08365 [Lachnospiraceae bacterium]|nr:hypothetical protein [Lachnospiraceae bacterium]
MSSLEAFVTGLIIFIVAVSIRRTFESVENIFLGLIREFIFLFSYVGIGLIWYSLHLTIHHREHIEAEEDEISQSGLPWGYMLLGLVACIYGIVNLFVRNISIMCDKVSVIDCILAELGYANVMINDVDFKFTRFSIFSLAMAFFVIVMAVLFIKCIRLLLVLRSPNIKKARAIHAYCYFMKRVFVLLFLMNMLPFIVVRLFYYNSLYTGGTSFEQEFVAGNKMVMAILFVGLLTTYICESKRSHKKE